MYITEVRIFFISFKSTCILTASLWPCKQILHLVLLRIFSQQRSECGTRSRWRRCLKSRSRSHKSVPVLSCCSGAFCFTFSALNHLVYMLHAKNVYLRRAPVSPHSSSEQVLNHCESLLVNRCGCVRVRGGLPQLGSAAPVLEALHAATLPPELAPSPWAWVHCTALREQRAPGSPWLPLPLPHAPGHEPLGSAGLRPSPLIQM